MGSDSDEGGDASNMCYIVQGDEPLEINFESELDLPPSQGISNTRREGIPKWRQFEK